MTKSQNDIVRIEKAIKKKYGEEAIQNPKKFWTKEKEKKYLEELRQFHEQRQVNNLEEQFQINEVKVKNKKFSHQVDKTCPICSTYSFSSKDDVYMLKFGCCFKCYIQHIEGRETRWKSGWRPNQ
tara:strand:+ start:593 stop:967 length:375 start_codon:yes stop_codon:yes gene_type:complete